MNERSVELSYENLRLLARGGTIEIDIGGERIAVRVDPLDVAKYRKKRNLSRLRDITATPGFFVLDAK